MPTALVSLTMSELKKTNLITHTIERHGSDCHLDDCNMYELNGEMVYITSANWPFVPPCLKVSVATINGFTPSVRPS